MKSDTPREAAMAYIDTVISELTNTRLRGPSIDRALAAARVAKERLQETEQHLVTLAEHVRKGDALLAAVQRTRDTMLRLNQANTAQIKQLTAENAALRERERTAFEAGFQRGTQEGLSSAAYQRQQQEPTP